MFFSLPQGTLVVGATQMPSSIFHASELGPELVRGAELVEMRSNICDVDTLPR